MSITILQQLFEKYFHAAPERVRPLQGELGGSGRRLVRLAAAGQSAVGVLYDAPEENAAFLEFSRHFRRYGLNVPEIYADDLPHGAYLEEDLGDETLFEFLSKHRQGPQIDPEVVDAYRKVISELPRFQIIAGRDLDYSYCYPRDSFDRQSIAWDLNYFKYYFLRFSGVAFNEQALEDDFTRLAEFLVSAGQDYFLYRDFQSRNVMLRNGNPWFLDYQGGRRGPLQYDVASLLYDGKADLPPELRQQLLDHYLDVVSGMIDLDRAAFMRYFYAYVYVRIMQAMGAYGFRGFYERKPHFLQSVPYALRNIRWLLHNAELPIAVPALMQAFRDMLGSEKLLRLAEHQQEESAVKKPATLTVRVSSFSFHRGGPPQDESGNGGGFVFDARSLPNPGREERFKQLTGRDAPVADYLDHQESVHHYLANVLALVNTSVKTYQARGFNSLMVSFGCTGGQHRSVYLAEQLAKHLRQVDGVEVVLRHTQLEKLAQEKNVR